MPFEPSAEAPSALNIAVVGAGVAGLGAAMQLSRAHKVTVFEAELRLGGHARTVLAGRAEQVAVDTGFIVFNRVTYPNLCALFTELGVPVQASDMSFSAQIDDGRIEYGIDGLASLFAQKKNLFDASFLRMTADIVRFAKVAADPGNDRAVTLGEWLEARGFSAAFRDHYLSALAGAIWSAPPQQMLDFPAETLLGFFRNHRLLSHRERVQWLTVAGGSRAYVDRIAVLLAARGARLRVGARVRRIERGEGVRLWSDGAETAERFDAVVLACHSDQALGLLADASAEERRVLGALRYAPSRVVLHDDARQMPKRRVCWSSWNARRRTGPDGGKSCVTYWMNNLQGLPAQVPLFVTLNPIDPIPDARVFDEVEFSHPVFDRAAIEAQAALPGLQGARGAFFCGAYARYGFHEDALSSGLAAADALLRAHA